MFNKAKRKVYHVITSSEADERWGFKAGNTRQSCVRGKLAEFIPEGYVRKSGATWLIDIQIMIQAHGYPFSSKVVPFIGSKNAYRAVYNDHTIFCPNTGILLNFYDTAEQAKNVMYIAFQKNIDHEVEKSGRCIGYLVRTKYGWNALDPRTASLKRVEKVFGDRALEIQEVVLKRGFSFPVINPTNKFMMKFDGTSYVFTYENGEITCNINDEITEFIKKMDSFKWWFNQLEREREEEIKLKNNYKVVLYFTGEANNEDDVIRNTELFIDEEYCGTLEEFNDLSEGKVGEFVNTSEVDQWIESVLEKQQEEAQLEKYIKK